MDTTADYDYAIWQRQGATGSRRMADNRCTVCHRSAHRPGVMQFSGHGHAYVAPKEVSAA